MKKHHAKLNYKVTIDTLFRKKVKFIIALFFLCQLVGTYGMYHKLLTTPMFLDELIVSQPPEYSFSVNPIFLKAPRGTFFILSNVRVFDNKIRRTLSNLTMQYNTDNEFRWFADHIIIKFYITSFGSTTDSFSCNMTLREYIDNVGEIKTNALSSESYLSIGAYISGWVNDSSFPDRNVTVVAARFIDIDFVLTAFMWRDANEAFEEISWLVYGFAVIDILLIVLFLARKRIKRFLKQPVRVVALTS